MTGPEHFREAEYLLAMSVEQRAGLLAGDPTAGDPDEAARIVALAQVHALLALAAASALGYDHIPTRDYQAWVAAAATPQEVTR